MAETLPRDILEKVERRWSERIRQNERFRKADRLKRRGKPRVEGVQPPEGPAGSGKGEIASPPTAPDDD